MVAFNLEVFDAKDPSRSIITLDNLTGDETILAIKKRIAQKKLKLTVERQSLRVEPKGKAVADEKKIKELGLAAQNAHLFVRDLGPQVPWKTVFLLEYAGPLFIYPIFYFRPNWIYGEGAANQPYHFAVTYAFICWSIHYAKRLFETQFIHRFSNGTMPRFNLVKNCSYYWGFAAFVAYFVNHPAYTPPYFGDAQVYVGLTGFAIAEFGNLSIHILLRNLRPPGTRERKIPRPDGNPMSLLFNFVSCPNYTYEVLSWLSFTVMVQSLPSLLFTLAGFVQMTIWAQNKHRAYKKEFPEYPKERKAIDLNMAELQAVLLCSGSGSRMTELCDTMLKCLLPVADIPMFWYPLNTLFCSGVKDIKIVVREDGKAEVKRLLETPLFAFPSANIEVIPVPRENEDWGTADVLRHIATKITRDFIVMSCDYISDARLQPMIDQFRAHNARRDFVAVEESSGRLAFVASEEDFDHPVNAAPWLNKFPNVNLSARYVDCHVYLMRHSCLGIINRQKSFSSLKADVVPYLLAQQYSEKNVAGRMLLVGTSGNGETPKCMAYFLQHGNATVAAHANNLGAYFEVNKSLEPRVLVKRSVIGSRCQIGEKSNIQGSVIMEGSTIGKEAKITLCIICPGAVIGDGAELTNVIVAKNQKVNACGGFNSV
ncbi:unnamed protein product [Nippostrongylus brasiliensis]|uniref:very-long-chain enoyl-CoA reductase n=1 Tax=Nippostrongylus brasiliensis TaxID=27835 RepID=A0A158R0N7_NIPBR|nr:unnamed protein product [Nippostrongylus brasiliensis]